MALIIAKRRTWCQCLAVLALLLAVSAAPAAAADDLATLTAETAQLWLYGGRTWQEAAGLFRAAGPGANGDRYRALLYAKQALLETQRHGAGLSAVQQDEAVRRLAEVDRELAELEVHGFMRLTVAELLPDRTDAARALLLAGMELDWPAARRDLLRDWQRARAVWTELGRVWAAAGDPEQAARLAAAAQEIDARIGRIAAEQAAAQQFLALAPEPRPAPAAPPVLPPIPLPEIRFTPADTGAVEAAAETTPAAAPEPERESQGIIDLQGPLESTLVINGRKFIRMTVSSVSYPDNPDETLSSTSLDIDQQLQVHIQGTVGKTITVNVDYDDAKPEVERQTMSITYQSLEHQTPIGVMTANAAFGDITLSIPSTQFVSYNSSLFGIMGGMDVKDFHLLGMSADRLSFDAMVTRAKGLPGRKVFYGAATAVIANINDQSYLARKYYRVTDDSGPDRAQLAMGGLRVYRDDHNAATNNANTILGKIVYNGGDSYTGDFDLLQEGPDYTVDNVTAIIKFRSTIGANYVIAVDYTTTAGWAVTAKMLRDQDGTDSYDVYELRNRYDLGSLNIIGEDPQFIFEIWGADDKPDTDTNNDGSTDQTWLSYFKLDRTGLPGNDGFLGTADDLSDGKIDREWIDFEQGIVTFPDSEPFRQQNPAIYGNNPVTRFRLHLEYKQKTQSYMLGQFNIIKGSDKVSINGHEIGRDQYYLDYESGFLTFYNGDLITPNAEIVIDYQYLPFGGQFQQTAVALRTEAEINPNMLVGTTAIMNWDAKPSSMPEVNATPHRNLVWDVNTVFDPLNAGIDFLNLFRSNDLANIDPGTADISITAEYAQSINDKNTFGMAEIDDIESLEDKVGFPKNERSWKPTRRSAAGYPGLSEVEAGHDPTVAQTDQDALRLAYDFTLGDSVAIRYPFSTVAKDLSNMLYLQFWARGADAVNVIVDIGVVSEDINGDGLYQTEDNNPHDGKLGPGEDNGLDGVAGTGDYGEGNGYLDEEDMDGDNQLDSVESYFRFANVELAADSYTVLVGADAWTRYRVPINQAVGFGDSSWTVAKHVRLWLTRKAGFTGTFDFDQLEIVGNRWTDANPADSSFFIGSVNTRDDPGYSPPNEIFGLTGRNPGDFEQALSLTYNSLNDSGSAYYLLPAKQRYRHYRQLIFWLLGDGQNRTFYLRFGADASNYFEQQVTLDFAGWREISIDLPMLEESLIGLYQSAATPFNHTIGMQRFVGVPELENIKELRVGIYGAGPALGSTVLVNQIYLKDALKQTGNVWATSFTSTFLDSLFTLNGAMSSRDNRFQLVGESTQSGENEPRESRDHSLAAGVALGRLLPEKWQVTAPLAVNWSRSRTDINPVSVDNVRRQEVGFNRSENRGISLALSQPSLPSANFSHSTGNNQSRNPSGTSEGSSRSTTVGLRYGSWPTLDAGRTIGQSRTVNTSQSVTSDQANWNLTSSWSYTFPQKLFDRIPTGQTLSLATNYGYTWNKSRSEYVIPAQVPTFDNVRTDRGGLSMTIQPVASFGINPAANYSRSYHWTPAERGMTARNRDLSLGFNLAGLWGFSPTLSTSGNFNENFYAAAGTGWNKDVSTGGSFNFGLGMNPSVWWSKLSFLNIRYAYTNAVSASYKSVPVSTSLGEVYRDYFRQTYWFWADQEPVVDGSQLSLARTSSSNNSAHTLDGNLAFWSPLWLGYNLSFNRARSQSQNSITPTNTFGAGLNSRLNLKEAWPEWMKNLQANSLTGNYSFKYIEQLTLRTMTHSPNAGWSVKWTDNFTTSLNVTYNQTNVDDRELHTIDRSLGPSVSTSYFFMNPFRVSNPVTGGGIEFQNQLRWDNTGAVNWQRKIGDPNSRIDQYNYNLSTSLSYSLRSNISASLSGNFAYYVDRLQLNMDHYNYGASASAEIRF